MKKIKKFRQNDFCDEQEFIPSKREHKQKKLNRALKTRDIDYLSKYHDEDECD